MMLAVNNNVPGMMFLDNTVFTLFETICGESQAYRFALITLRSAINFHRGSFLENNECIEIV
jgi:hypothetical protein